MLKMAGTNTFPQSGWQVSGKYGRYLLKEKIGNGGNGAVFAVDVIERESCLPQNKDFAIKFLVVTTKDEEELEKRKERFVKEIKKVLLIQDIIKEIIPIYDTSIYADEKQDSLWYLMPKAEAYIPKRYSIEQRLGHMLQLGKCLKQLHEMGYAHRDIKPKNLLVFQGKVCLADFGLIWNINDTDEHITEVNDRLGPQAIRPPELQPVEKVDGVDYRKSDVYLYAKTIWMVLHCNNRGFPAEYSRQADQIYIDKDKFQFETVEPLHLLMEKSTKHNHWERIDIDECIYYLENQIAVIADTIPKNLLKKWKYSEQTKRLDATVPSDEKIYTDPLAIEKILSGMAGTVNLVFFDAEKEYVVLPLRKAKYIQSKFFEIEINNPYNNFRKKTLEIAVKNICRKKNMTYEIRLLVNLFDENPIPVFTNIIKALQSPYKMVCLNAMYLIRMEQGL